MICHARTAGAHRVWSPALRFGLPRESGVVSHPYSHVMLAGRPSWLRRSRGPLAPTCPDDVRYPGHVHSRLLRHGGVESPHCTLGQVPHPLHPTGEALGILFCWRTVAEAARAEVRSSLVWGELSSKDPLP